MPTLSQDEADRAELRMRWAQDQLGTRDMRLQRASVDAGFRSYWRATTAMGSHIVMDSPPTLEDVRPWLKMRDLLARARVRVPGLMAIDIENGFLLLEDLGKTTLAQIIDSDNADDYFDAAFEQLLRLQAIDPPSEIGCFDDRLLTRDATLFREWFLQHHLKIALNRKEMKSFHRTLSILATNVKEQTWVLTHRDFMPRNLMPTDKGLAVLDFQDCIRGPIAYDPISLFKDAFLSWPSNRVDRWLERYHARAVDGGLPVPAWETFRRDADCSGIQRHLKILGIFARLHYRDAKRRYLEDASRFIRYLNEVLPRYPEFRFLEQLLHERIEPAMEAHQAPASLPE